MKFRCSSSTKPNQSTKEINARIGISPLSLSFKFLAKREQISERAHPLSTYSLHTLTLVLKVGLRRPLKIPPWRDAIIGATPSHNATSTKTQTLARRRSVPAGKLLFLTHSLCSAEGHADAGADQMFPALWLRAAGSRTG